MTRPKNTDQAAAQQASATVDRLVAARRREGLVPGKHRAGLIARIVRRVAR
jgi:hypothetical protein